MITALARFITNKTGAWIVIVVVLCVGGAGGLLARQVKNEDDVLAFLPRGNPEVRLFHQINERFGGLDLALVGIQSDQVFSADFLSRLRQATKELKETKGLDHVLSLANVMDFTPDRERGGIVTDRLVAQIPRSEAAQKALRAKVMSRDHIVGNFISRDGDAVLLYGYLAYGSDPKAMAAAIKKVVQRHFPREKTYWGGGPFVSTYIYNTTQEDMRRLTPWAVGTIVLIMMLAFRDVLGSFLALLSTGMGIVISLGTMALLGVRYNIVLSAMPVILFAVGSAYGIHVLARYYTLSQQMSVRRAVLATITGVGPTVLAAGLTTAASLLSFIWMDIRPLRTFGIFTALGILSTLVLSLTFIPAVARVSGIKRKQATTGAVRRAMVRLTLGSQRHRALTISALAGLSALGLAFAARVDTRMDQSTFFSPGSPPDQAERFLSEHFGGAQFVQLYFKGSMTDPAVLRELRGLGDAIALLPHVSSVQHLGLALGQVNKILVGQQRIPDTEAQVRTLYSFLAGDPAAAQLVSPDRKQALMHVKVDSNRARVLEPLIARMEALAHSAVLSRFDKVSVAGPRGAEARARIDALLARQVLALAKTHGVGTPKQADERLKQALAARPPAPSPEAVAAAVRRFLGSDECVVELPEPAEGQPAPARRVAAAAVALGPKADEDALIPALAAALGRDEEDELVLDLALSLAMPLHDFWRLDSARRTAKQVVRQAGLTVPEGGHGARFFAATTMALLDRQVAEVAVPPTVRGEGETGAGTLEVAVNGLPVMYRGLSHSVTQNQIKSLASALLLVLVIMTVLFRSFWSGLLVSLPTLITLLAVYGGMGYLGVHLDIGTSMLASIVLGAGVDYAVHLAAAWQAPRGGTIQQSAAVAADHAGPAIWTNAVMVAAGFFVLTLGEARPLQNVGGLTSAAMITAALATFLAFPALARRLRYRQAPQADEPPTSEAVDAVLKGSKV